VLKFDFEPINIEATDLKIVYVTTLLLTYICSSYF